MQEAATQRVLSWGLAQLRDLPWRRTRDPWEVLVSEVMLQQTQVERVIPRWFEFLEVYPTPDACAAAGLGDVLRLWQGLGYPRRARNLHAAATAVAAAGSFPDTLAGLLALPGVGPYTARAILAFAFEAEAAVVDTNIARVFARVAGHRLTAREVQAMADAALIGEQPWAWNQGLMDLGAVLCRPTSPRCAECPLGDECAYRGGATGIGDPAPGSAGVSGRQSPFEGSGPAGRGRLMHSRAGPHCAPRRWPLRPAGPINPSVPNARSAHSSRTASRCSTSRPPAIAFPEAGDVTAAMTSAMTRSA